MISGAHRTVVYKLLYLRGLRLKISNERTYGRPAAMADGKGVLSLIQVWQMAPYFMAAFVARMRLCSRNGPRPLLLMIMLYAFSK
jgi:ABC-type sugar transport system permease subunit